MAVEGRRESAVDVCGCVCTVNVFAVWVFFGLMCVCVCFRGVYPPWLDVCVCVCFRGVYPPWSDMCVCVSGVCTHHGEGCCGERCSASFILSD